jgi:outer membrane receptor protein involved in Fe transport
MRLKSTAGTRSAEDQSKPRACCAQYAAGCAYRSAYAQDDWRLNSKLTLNLGLRYDYFQPFTNKNGDMTNLVVTSKGIGTGTGILYVPSKLQGQSTFAPAFLSLLASQNVMMKYTNNLSIAAAQKTNFAPRVGMAYMIEPNTVIRGGFGIFYGGLESIGGTESTVLWTAVPPA